MAFDGFPEEVHGASKTSTRPHFYPAPRAQGKQKDPEYEQLLGLVEERIQELDRILQPTSDTDDTSGLFNEWCAKTAGMWYPDIGKKAHAVPWYFHGKRDVRPYKEAPDLDFVVSKTPAAAQRGDKAHRVLGRQLRVMNAELERKGEKTMFIISQLHYDNLLGLIRNKSQKGKQHFSTSFRKVFGKPASYIDIDAIKKQLEAHRGKVDLMILHEDKGIIFIQVKSISREMAVDAEDSTVSPSTPTPISCNTIEKKVTAAAEQLSKDASLLGKVMGRSSHWKTQDTTSIVKQVIAVPNLTRQDLSDSGLQEKVKKEIIFLCKEDTMEETAESIEDAESEAKIDMFRNWWNQLPSLEKPLPVDMIKEIVGKYIGPLSTVLDQKPGNLTDRLRRFIDCVKHTSDLSACRVLTHTQRRILEKKTTGQRRVYISGPPGSGQTILLILKAATFLGQSTEHRVIVVNMYRGAPGRAIGQHIFNTISKQGSFKKRVHQLQVDVDRKEFIEKANAILVKAGVKKRGVAEDASTEPQQTEKGAETDSHVAQKKTDQKDGSRPAVSAKPEQKKPCGKKKPASADDRRRREEETKSLTTGDRSGKLDEHSDVKASSSTESTVGMKDVLFLVDEIYIESFWEEITGAFSGEFAESEVWCAGLFSKNPAGFVEHALDFVLRCPPAVQNLLYHVDWDLERRKLYRRDAEMTELATNGPVPLCVRHEAHVFKEEGAPCRVIDCARCAVELADVLKGENITKTTTRKDRAQSEPPAPASCARGKSATMVAASTKLKVVLLLNIPRDKYTKAGPYIETTDEEYKKYMDYVKSSKFIKTLKEQDILVDVKAQLACKTLEEEEEGGGSVVTATWLYNFQGLEAGVVIFLPGDPARNPDAPAQEPREIPAPGLKTVTTAQAPEQTGNQTPSTKKTPSQAAGIAGEHKPAFTRSVSSTETHEEAEKVELRHRSPPPDVAGRTGAGRGGAGGGACPYSLSQLLWKKADIARYSDWDKTNILVAGSRSLSLFILMVP